MIDYSVSMSDISPGDACMLVTVSGSDVLPGADAILEKLDTANFLLSALLFFTVFTWAESRIKNGVRKVMKNE